MSGGVDVSPSKPTGWTPGTPTVEQLKIKEEERCISFVPPVTGSLPAASPWEQISKCSAAPTERSLLLTPFKAAAALPFSEINA